MDKHEYSINKENKNENAPDFTQIQNIMLEDEESRYDITKEIKYGFICEAIQFEAESKQGDATVLKVAWDHLLDTSDSFFEDKEELTEIEEIELFGLLLRLKLITTKFSYVKKEQIKEYIFDLINLAKLLIKYPHHLSQILSIIINFSTAENIEEYFIHKEWKLISIFKDILREYEYCDKNAEIIQGVYLCFLNLIVSS